tara:strand:+ start:303 stop:752 length:450 start_codon:yes stop_codon:yes gene_type:complete
MPVASRTFANLEVMQNADFSQNVPFTEGYNMATKDYSMAIATDAGVVATTLMSDHDVAGNEDVARLIKNAGGDDTGVDGVESYLTIYIPATGAAGTNTFGTDDFADGFEGTWELLETDSSTPSVTTRQAEGEIIVRTAVTPFLAYSPSA